MYKPTLLVALAASLQTIGVAAQPEPTGDSSNTELRIEHVYVVAGTPAPGDQMVQAARIDVLEGVEKSLRQAASLGQSLEHLAGVRVLDTGNNAGIPVIRGLTGNRIRVLSNSIGVDYQQYGIRHNVNVDPFLSDRIEIVRGAASLLYGSDAIGGVIDVHGINLGQSSSGNREQDFAARYDYASNNGQQDFSVRGISAGERFTIGGGFAVRSGDSINTPDSATAFESGDRDGPVYTGELPFTDFDQSNGQLGIALHGDNSTTTLRYSQWNNEQNYLLVAPPDGAGIGVALNNEELQLRTDYVFDSGSTQWTLRPTLSWQNNLRRANAPGNPRSGLFDGDIEIEFDQYVFRLEALHEGDQLFDRGTLGFEIRERDQVSRGRTVLSPGGKVKNAALFAYEEQRFGMLVVQAGLRYDHVETVGDDSKTTAQPSFTGQVTNTYDVVTGALGGSYPLNDHWTLAANLAQGFRAPTLFEQFASGVHGGVAAIQIGNPDLEPERSLNTDLSLRWRYDAFNGSVTVYNNEIDDYIYLTSSGDSAPNGLPIFNHEQTNATLQGVEVEMEWSPAPHWQIRTVVDIISTENDATGENLPLTPANELLTEVTWRPNDRFGLRDSYARVGVRYSEGQTAAPGEPFQQFDRNPVFGSASTDSYWLINASMGGLITGPAGRDIRLNLEVRNAFDETYRDFLNTYKAYALNPGRDIRLTVEIPFKG
jgi:outer membrane receptor protein involved in Fe transport